MTGRPAARIGDGVVRGKVVTGSGSVLIGEQGGVACVPCLQNAAAQTPHPVNAQLGAKVLSGAEELDFALPGPLPLVWQRQYSSYVNRQQGGRCGLMGFGWSMPLELSLSVQETATLLHDSQGRTITFGALEAGEALYSPSEDLWLLRCGAHAGQLAHELAALTLLADPEPAPAGPSAQPSSSSLSSSPSTQPPERPRSPQWHQGRWAWVSQELASSAGLILAGSGSSSHTLWVFAPENWQAIEAARRAARAATTPTPLPAASRHWQLLGKIDRFGRTQRWRLDEVLGRARISVIEDGAGRLYQLHYRRVCAPRGPQHFASGHHWHADDGVRLVRIELTRDPLTPLEQEQPIALVRYDYSPEGDLQQVHGRGDAPTRHFQYLGHLMVLHQSTGGPEHHYVYDRHEPGGRVIEQRNPEGLTYRFSRQRLPEHNGQPCEQVRVSDSLGRQDTYCFEGEAGLARLTCHQRADGSTVRRGYNAFGQLTAIIDPLGRTTRMALSPQGQLLAAHAPDGSTSSQSWSEDGLLQSSTDAAGRATGYAYDQYQRLVQVIRADGTTESYAYPGPAEQPLIADSPHRITDAKGGVRQLQFNPAGLLASHTDCSGHSTHYAYTRFGELAAITNALGERTRYSWDEQGRLQATHHPDGAQERYRHNEQGQIIQVSAGHSRAAQKQQTDPSALPASTTAATVSMEYDRWGRLTRREHAGHALAFAYDAAGRLSQLINENGETSHFEWDAMDRLIRETGFDQRVQTYAYDATGQLTQTSDGSESQQGAPGHTSHYEWDAAGRLEARRLPATGQTPATVQRYGWSQAGELLSARVFTLDAEGSQQLHTEALLERDALGRIAAEVQRLYKDEAPTGDNPELEYEHRMAHELDALGNRQASQLQALGQVEYLLYGSGHVHGMAWNQQPLIDFERDALHREVKCQLLPPRGQDMGTTGPGHTPAPALTRTLGWDAAGRLQQMHWVGLDAPGTSLPDLLDAPAAAGTAAAARVQVPQVLIGQLTQRQYRYDSLGQMVGIHTPQGTNQYAYDAAGRLVAATSSDGSTQRWRFDAAGNRLPITTGGADTPADEITGDLSATDRLRRQQRARASAHPIAAEELSRKDFNALAGPAEPAGSAPAAAQMWPGNRIAAYSNSEDASSNDARLSYHYDSRGNRTEAADEANHKHTHYDWDAGNQLAAVTLVQQEGGKRTATEERYRYDAFGRRLARYSATSTIAGDSEQAMEQSRFTEYFGWDGDRLVRTERVLPNHQGSGQGPDGTEQEQRQIIHTVYEPGSFTPLVRLQKTVTGEDDSNPIAQALQQVGNPEAQTRLRHYLQDPKGTAALVQQSLAALGAAGTEAAGFITEQLQELKRLKQEQDDADIKGVELSFYLCDHLGTPNALVDRQGQIAWAARLDSWGNIQEEFNPASLRQSIRLPGQQQDKETGLYYNRHRYYDPKIGTYVSQDPIGINGGINVFNYSENSLRYFDALGLQYSDIRLSIADRAAGLPPPRDPSGIYGNWCGPNWTGGRVEEYSSQRAQQKGHYDGPIDELDAACEIHDKAYQACRLENCDRSARRSCMKKADNNLNEAAKLYSAKLPWWDIYGKTRARIIGGAVNSNPFPPLGKMPPSCSK